MLTIEEIRQAFEARQTALEKCKAGEMSWLEGDSLDAMFKNRSVEFIETLLDHIDKQAEENARLRAALDEINNNPANVDNIPQRNQLWYLQVTANRVAAALEEGE